MITAGKIAPDFVLKDTENREIALQNFRGKFVLLLFYPRDNTRVCTKQMREYRDNWQTLQLPGLEIFAINPASTETHKDFKKKNNLPFPVLSDENSVVAKKYDALNILGMTKRSYVLISPEGKVLVSKSELSAMFYTSADELVTLVRRGIESYQAVK